MDKIILKGDAISPTIESEVLSIGIDIKSNRINLTEKLTYTLQDDSKEVLPISYLSFGQGTVPMTTSELSTEAGMEVTYIEEFMQNITPHIELLRKQYYSLQN
jgi:hypothetical protein